MASTSVLAMQAFDGVSKRAPPTKVKLAYGLFSAVAFMIYHMVAEREFSALLTISAIIQCLAIALLAIKVASTGSSDGISTRALLLDAVAFACRLSSTVWLNGYLPADITGDWIYQVVDMCSLAFTLWLLLQIVTTRRQFSTDKDCLPIAGIILGAFVLAALLHGDLDDRPVFDTLWMTGLFVGTVQVLPQLFLITQKGGRVEALTSHYVAMMALSRFISGTFMWYAKDDLTCKEWIEGFNHASFAILAAHAIHLFLLGDFAFYYFKAVAKHGLSCSVEIEPTTWV